MKVLWIGMNDKQGCVGHWGALRRTLRDDHGVRLKGPGYSYPGNPRMRLSDLLDGDEEWVVLDDCNAMGYPRLLLDRRPPCKVAWREHDWHNRQRQAVATLLEPDLVLGCYRRQGAYPPNWVHVPQCVDTSSFHPGNGQPREFPVGFFGRVCKTSYPDRVEAVRHIRTIRGAWLPVHGGYWRDGRGSGEKTRYRDELAEDLRHVACLYVAGGKWNGAVLKFFEGAACGCLLMGKVPEGWEELFPKDSMLPCEPHEIGEFVEWFREHEEQRAEFARLATEHALEHHSVKARARQIMEVLRAA